MPGNPAFVVVCSRLKRARAKTTVREQEYISVYKEILDQFYVDRCRYRGDKYRLCDCR